MTRETVAMTLPHCPFLRISAVALHQLQLHRLMQSQFMLFIPLEGIIINQLLKLYLFIHFVSIFKCEIHSKCHFQHTNRENWYVFFSHIYTK